MSKNIRDLTGQRFGRLVAIRIAYMRKQAFWLFRCDCGKEVVTKGNYAVRGGSRSCGCLKADLTRARNIKTKTKHGLKYTPEYRAWRAMKTRCFNNNIKDFYNYGGRGITVFGDWIDSFEAFYAYVGARPGLSYSLDRIDNNGNYVPGNVRWATKSEQRKNQRKRGVV